MPKIRASSLNSSSYSNRPEELLSRIEKTPGIERNFSRSSVTTGVMSCPSGKESSIATGSPAPMSSADTVSLLTDATSPTSSRHTVSNSLASHVRIVGSVICTTTLASVAPPAALPPLGPPPPTPFPTTIFTPTITGGAALGNRDWRISPARIAADCTSSATRCVIANVVPSFISMLAVTKSVSMDGKKLNFTYPWINSPIDPIIRAIDKAIGIRMANPLVVSRKIASNG